jgi:hypothetical protein
VTSCIQRIGLYAIVSLALGCTADSRGDDDTATRAATSEAQQDIGGGGGGGSCSPPRDDCPTLPPPSCSGKPICYCLCRVSHPCATNGSQCGPLGTCLDQCDASYAPSCPGGGNPNPRTAADCL